MRYCIVDSLCHIGNGHPRKVIDNELNDNIYVRIKKMMDIVEYEDEDGSHPYSKWFVSLNVQAA